jgi:hypothetical protein
VPERGPEGETVHPHPDAAIATPQPAEGLVEGRAEETALTLADARLAMRQIYDRARTLKVQVGALLNSACDIIDANEQEIVLGFKYAAQLDMAAKQPNLELLTEAVSDVIGRPIRVRCTLDAQVESWQRRDSASRNSLVRAAQEMGARVLSSEPED